MDTNWQIKLREHILYGTFQHQITDRNISSEQFESFCPCHEHSRFLLKSGMFFIFQDSTRFDGIIAEHQIVHPVPLVLNFSVWYSIKRASRGEGIFGDAVVCSRALDDLILFAKLEFVLFINDFNA